MIQLKPLFIVVFMFCSSYSIAQNRNNIWCFGDSSGIDFGSAPNPTTFRTSVVSRGSCASIADTNGNLLFYSHTRSGIGNGLTTLVFDSTHNLMQNGTYIRGEAWYHELLIVPNPNTLDQYFLFSTNISSGSGFYYSKIDLSLNNGLGSVIQKNVILNTLGNADCVTGIKHGNGIDWWVISKYSNSNLTNYNRFSVFLVTKDSIYAPIIQDLSNALDIGFQQLTFNSDGTKLMQTGGTGLMQEINFDRCTGLLSNPSVIFPEFLTGPYSRYFWSGAYSHDNSKFYSIMYPSLSDTSRVIQFDLNAVDIPTSADTILMATDSAILGALSLGPDNKIYISTFYYFGFPGYPFADTSFNQYNTNLSVINFPDSAGNACDIQPYSFNLGGSRTYSGLPNNPNYDLGPVVGSGCDTITTLAEPIAQTGANMFVYHDSEWEIAFVNAKNLKGKFGIISIYDLQGKLVHPSSIPINNGTCTSDVSTQAFSKGMYLVQILTEKETMSRKFLVE